MWVQWGDAVLSQGELWLNAMIKFRKATWVDFQPGDILYYLTQFQKTDYEDNNAHGPMVVVDPVEGIIQNSSGVKIKALTWRIQLLKIDLVSMLVGD